MNDPEKYIVVSYVPLLTATKRILKTPSEQYTPEHATEIAEEIGGTLEDTPSVHVKACLWLQTSEDEAPEFCPVFLIDNATEVVDHLLYWCENDVAAWFYLYLEKIDNERYIALLFPNLSKSIERFKLACMAYADFVPQSDADYSLVFKPLEFLSQGATMFDSVQGHLGDELKIGFLNTDEFDQSHPETCLDKVRYIGPIRRIRRAEEEGKNSYIIPYIEKRLKEIEEEDDD